MAEFGGAGMTMAQPVGLAGCRAEQMAATPRPDRQRRWKRWGRWPGIPATGRIWGPYRWAWVSLRWQRCDSGNALLLQRCCHWLEAAVAAGRLDGASVGGHGAAVEAEQQHRCLGQTSRPSRRCTVQEIIPTLSRCGGDTPTERYGRRAGRPHPARDRSDETIPTRCRGGWPAGAWLARPPAQATAGASGG